jgi:hypothetical protein
VVCGVTNVIPLVGNYQDWIIFARTSPDTANSQTYSNRPQVLHGHAAPAYRLLPKVRATRTSERDAENCLKLATEADEPPDPKALAMLGGRSTQAFITQFDRDGPIFPEGTNVRLSGKWVPASWVPATHQRGFEKHHWQSPSVADRYVLCLLQNGYEWEDVGEVDPDQRVFPLYGGAIQ